MLEPFEKKNLVFLDTEFTDLDPYTGEILSIGIVKLSGEELYLELECDAKPSAWVKRRILPMLKEDKVSRIDAAKKIKKFLGKSNPFAVAFVDNYDVIYLTKIFGAGNLPFRWMTIDFASILFAAGINPSNFIADGKGVKEFYKKLEIDLAKYKSHHALDDAKLLREAWIKVAAL